MIFQRQHTHVKVGGSCFHFQLSIPLSPILLATLMLNDISHPSSPGKSLHLRFNEKCRTEYAKSVGTFNSQEETSTCVSEIHTFSSSFSHTFSTMNQTFWKVGHEDSYNLIQTPSSY